MSDASLMFETPPQSVGILDLEPPDWVTDGYRWIRTSPRGWNFRNDIYRRGTGWEGEKLEFGFWWVGLWDWQIGLHLNIRDMSLSVHIPCGFIFFRRRKNIPLWLQVPAR